MPDSILDTTKKVLNVVDNAFDQDLVVAINSAIDQLESLGVGPTPAYAITGATQTWEDYLPEVANRGQVQSYIWVTTRILFDPPTSGIQMDALKNIVTKLESRFTLAHDLELARSQNGINQVP